MKKLTYLLAAGAMALSPAITLAGPGSHGGGMGHGASMGAVGGGGSMTRGASANMITGSRMTRTSQDTTQAGQGSTHGQGWDHQNGPSSTGQPGVECEDGVPPGHSSSAPGSAFNEDGKAGTHYAGEQPQNSRNTASVSQYDTACLRPQH